MHKLVLGSRSPRRKEILEYFSLAFTQVHSSFNECSIPFKNDPAVYAIAISKGKAEDLQKKFPNALVLTADTIVFCEGKVFGIPKDKEQALKTLNFLNGRWHEVYTGLTLNDIHSFETTKVLMNNLSETEIESYLNSNTWSDKAGGYAIQGATGLMVKKIDGCFYNVMGLPINALSSLLKRKGIDLWNHLKA